MLTVYHGSTCRIEEPLAGVCRPNLDFGIGFYVTDLKEQAVRWALRTAEVCHKDEAWLNVYSLDMDVCRVLPYRYLCFIVASALRKRFFYLKHLLHLLSLVRLIRLCRVNIGELSNCLRLVCVFLPIKH